MSITNVEEKFTRIALLVAADKRKFRKMLAFGESPDFTTHYAR